MPLGHGHQYLSKRETTGSARSAATLRCIYLLPTWSPSCDNVSRRSTLRSARPPHRENGTHDAGPPEEDEISGETTTAVSFKVGC